MTSFLNTIFEIIMYLLGNIKHCYVTFQIYLWWLLLYCSLCIHLLWCCMKSSTSKRFRQFWFGGVTDWYQSNVYSELVYQPMKDIQTINTKGLRISDKQVFIQTYFWNIRIFCKSIVCTQPLVQRHSKYINKSIR